MRPRRGRARSEPSARWEARQANRVRPDGIDSLRRQCVRARCWSRCARIARARPEPRCRLPPTAPQPPATQRHAPSQRPIATKMSAPSRRASRRTSAASSVSGSRPPPSMTKANLPGSACRSGFAVSCLCERLRDRPEIDDLGGIDPRQRIDRDVPDRLACRAIIEQAERRQRIPQGIRARPASRRGFADWRGASDRSDRCRTATPHRPARSRLATGRLPPCGLIRTISPSPLCIGRRAPGHQPLTGDGALMASTSAGAVRAAAAASSSITALRRGTQSPRRQASCSRATIDATAAGLRLSIAPDTERIAEQCRMGQIEQMRGHSIRCRRERIERIDALRDLGDAAIAMRQHAGDPSGIGEAAAHHARDLFGQSPRLRRLRPAGVEMQQRRRNARAPQPPRQNRRRNPRPPRHPAGHAHDRPVDEPAHRRCACDPETPAPAPSLHARHQMHARRRRDRPRRVGGGSPIRFRAPGLRQPRHSCRARRQTPAPSSRHAASPPPADCRHRPRRARRPSAPRDRTARSAPRTDRGTGRRCAT